MVASLQSVALQVLGAAFIAVAVAVPYALIAWHGSWCHHCGLGLLQRGSSTLLSCGRCMPSIEAVCW
jgi:hypothetical protein